MNSYKVRLQGKQSAFFGLLWVVLLLVAGGGSAWAQATASFSGRVEDASGAAIPSATVTARNLETGAVRTVTTDHAGNYRILSLPVGRYEVAAEKTGFNRELRTGITLVVGQEAVVNLKLEVGQIQQQVTVTAEAPIVNTTTSSVSGLVGEQEVKNLPLNGRSFDSLITLDPGTVNMDSTRTAGGLGGTGNVFSISGRRFTENLFLLNGVEYVGAFEFDTMPGGVSGQALGIDAIREFNVLKDSYGAEYGKRAGGQIAIVTMSGSNQFHGSAFEFLRNSDLDARNFFDYPPGLRIPPFRRNNFGAAAGAPIEKDRTFIFGNYEGFRQRLGLSDVTFVPDLNARQGLVPTGPGGSLVNVGVAPGVAPYFALWPLPNGPDLGGGIAEAFSNPKQTIREDFFTVRADHSFSSKDSLNGVYTFDDGFSYTPETNPLIADTLALRSQVASLQEVHVFSGSLINAFTLGFSRSSLYYNSENTIGFPPSMSFVQGAPVGTIVIGGTFAGSSFTDAGSGPSTNSEPSRNIFTVANNLSWTKGAHLISAGVWFERMQLNDNTVAYHNGLATFSSLTSFLQGVVAVFTGTPTQARLGFRSLEGAWYLQDTMKLRPNLTLTLGLRHEFTNGWNEVAGRAADYIPGPNNVLSTQPRVGDSLFTANNSIKLFGPRAGLAWDPFGNGKTSIRAGFGIYYDLFDDVVCCASNYDTVITVTNHTFPLQVIPGEAYPGAVPTPGGILPNFETPTVIRYTFQIEQAIGGNMGVSAAYVGSHGYHGEAGMDLNLAIPQIVNGTEFFPLGDPRRNPSLSYSNIWTNAGFNFYNALQLEVKRRFSRGLQFRANYTFSKSMDNSSVNSGVSSTNSPATVMEPDDPQRDLGLSVFDIRHRFSLDASYELPVGAGKAFLGQARGAAGKLVSGWQVNAIFSAQSGLPFTPTLGFNNSRDGDARAPDRPNWAPGVSSVQYIGTPNQWFNPDIFVNPPAGTYGNVGRDVLIGPRLTDLDLSLFKSTKISERLNLQFRFESFNLLNQPGFATPSTIVSSSSGAIPPTAGVISKTAITSRQLQFGLKLIW